MDYEVERIRSLQGNAYLIRGESIALVDTLGKGELRVLLRALSKRGVSPRDIDFILLTHHHVDHAANAAALKELSGATLVVGEKDAGVVEGRTPTPPPSGLSRVGRFLGRLPGPIVDLAQEYGRVEVDTKAEDGDTIDELGLEVVSLPGHTPGGVCYLDREGRRAFIGDMVTRAFSRLCMPSLAFSESIQQIFASQRLIADMGLETAYPGHGTIIRRDASAAIRDFSNRKAAELLKE